MLLLLLLLLWHDAVCVTLVRHLLVSLGGRVLGLGHGLMHGRVRQAAAAHLLLLLLLLLLLVVVVVVVVLLSVGSLEVEK